MDLVGWWHDRFVHSRRVAVLAQHLTAPIPHDASVLDVGCGDGRVAATIARQRPDITISGIDTFPRKEARIPVREFDGVALPYPDRGIDVVLFVDVLHHAADPMALLRDACRVARRAILIKDHCRDGALAGATLRAMDWVGNARHGVALPYHYWTSEEWRRAIDDLGLQRTTWKRDLRLYPAPFRWIFERSLHFIAVLTVS